MGPPDGEYLRTLHEGAPCCALLRLLCLLGYAGLLYPAALSCEWPCLLRLHH